MLSLPIVKLHIVYTELNTNWSKLLKYFCAFWEAAKNKLVSQVYCTTMKNREECGWGLNSQFGFLLLIPTWQKLISHDLSTRAKGTAQASDAMSANRREWPQNPRALFCFHWKESKSNHSHLLSVGSTGGSVVLGFLVFFSVGFEVFEASAIKTNNKIQILLENQ